MKEKEREVKKGESWRRGYETGYAEGYAAGLSFTEKAFGGCTNCFGKGYSTHMQNLVGAEDFGGDGFEEGPRIHITYCRCERGRQLKALFGIIPSISVVYGDDTVSVRSPFPGGGGGKKTRV